MAHFFMKTRKSVAIQTENPILVYCISTTQTSSPDDTTIFVKYTVPFAHRNRPTYSANNTAFTKQSSTNFLSSSANIFLLSNYFFNKS